MDFWLSGKPLYFGKELRGEQARTDTTPIKSYQTVAFTFHTFS